MSCRALLVEEKVDEWAELEGRKGCVSRKEVGRGRLLNQSSLGYGQNQEKRFLS